MGDATLIGGVITAVVTIIIAAFALVKQAMKQANNTQHNSITPTADCLNRILRFMDSTEKVLVEASRIQHTHSRYMNDLRQELSHLRTEISEMKGMLR